MLSWLVVTYCVHPALCAAQSRPTTGRQATDTLTVGVSYFVNDQTNISEQFALWQLLHDNPVPGLAQPCRFTLADQPFGYLLAVTGRIRQNKLTITWWKKGQIMDRQVLTASSPALTDVLRTSYEFVAMQLNRQSTTVFTQPTKSPKLSFKNILLSPPTSVAVGKGADLLPGRVPCPVPANTHLADAYMKVSPIHYLVVPKLTEHTTATQLAQLPHALYDLPEESFFLLRHQQIPAELQEGVRKLAYPTCHRPGMPIAYLAAGERFEKASDLSGAASAYMSSLIACNDLNASPPDKAAIKRIAFNQLAIIAEQRKQPYTASLMRLAHRLNTHYLQSDKATSERKKYYDLMAKVGNVCDQVEQQAREVRAQKRKNGFLAVLNFASSMASSASGDQVSSDLASQNMSDALTESAQLTSDLQTQMGEFAQLFESKFSRQINKYAASDGNQVAPGSTFLARELTEQLLYNQDNALEQLLIDFTDDKPTMAGLLINYITATTEEIRLRRLTALYQHINQLELQVYGYEYRGQRVPLDVTLNF